MAKLADIVNLEQYQISFLTQEAMAELNSQLTDTITNLDGEVKEIDETSGAITDAENSIQYIEDMQEAVGTSDSPPTGTEISVVESFHSSILYSLGIPHLKLTTESRSTLTRGQLVLTLEEKKEDILDKIIRVVKSLVNSVVGFVSKILQNKTMLEKYISGLLSTASSYADKEGKDIPSQFADYNSAVAAMRNCTDFMKLSDKYVDKLEEVIKRSNNGGYIQGAEVDAAKSDFNSLRVTEGSVFAKGDVVSWRPVKSADVDGVQLVTESPNEAVTQGKRLQKAQIISILNMAKTGLNELSKLKSTGNKLLEFGKRFVDRFKIAMSRHKAIESKDTGDKSVGRMTLAHNSTIATYRSIATVAAAKVPSLVFKNIKAAADYAKASMA